MTTFHIEFLKPAIVEGRAYEPFSFAEPNKCFLETCRGKRRRFMTRQKAHDFLRECFGQDYNKIAIVREN